MSNLLYCIFHITSLAIRSKLSGVTSHARSSKQSLNGTVVTIYPKNPEIWDGVSMEGLNGMNGNFLGKTGCF